MFSFQHILPRTTHLLHCSRVLWAVMNAQQRAALQPLLLKDVKETGKELGRGAYGVVTEVIVSGTVCAAKKLHDVIVQVKLTLHLTTLLFIYAGAHIEEVQ